MKILYKLILGLMGALPEPCVRAIGHFGGWIFGSVMRHHREDARDALTRAFPEKTPAEIEAIVKQMYRNLGLNLAEFLHMGPVQVENARQLVIMENEQILRDVLARGKGMLVLTAHVGNWDLFCTIIPSMGYPLTVITKRMRNVALTEVWMKRRERFGLKFVEARNSFRQCLRVLKRNEVVGFILDQNMINTEGVFVDFFGRPACTSPGLALMSYQSGAPVVPAFIIREPDGTHHVKIFPALEPPPDREPETIRRATQQYTAAIERIVRQYPDQWIWLHRRWKTQPKTDATP